MDKKNVYKLLDAGSDIIGEVGSEGFLGALLGPWGALATKTVGKIISGLVEKVGGDIYERTLSPQQRIRLGAVGVYMLTSIQERLNNGETYRTGDFWEAAGINRSKAEEILEGVWLNAKDTYEQQKLPHIANIYAYTAFNNISYHAAHQILKLVDTLSYRQLCILSLYNRDITPYHLRKDNYNLGEIDIETEAVLLEIFELYNSRMIIGKETPHSGDFIAFLDTTAIHPAYLSLTPLAKQLCIMAALSNISEEEIVNLVVKRLQ